MLMLPDAAMPTVAIAGVTPATMSMATPTLAAMRPKKPPMTPSGVRVSRKSRFRMFPEPMAHPIPAGVSRSCRAGRRLEMCADTQCNRSAPRKSSPQADPSKSPVPENEEGPDDRAFFSKIGWGTWTRTKNKGTRNLRVANYTIPQGARAEARAKGQV